MNLIDTEYQDLLCYILGNGVENAVRRVVGSYENYINSKIEFTGDYFKKD
tara:strand:- start:945 stop:1094 length:150 start_codon:yes stop_codon:yes gene_type:complete